MVNKNNPIYRASKCFLKLFSLNNNSVRGVSINKKNPKWNCHHPCPLYSQKFIRKCFQRKSKSHQNHPTACFAELVEVPPPHWVFWNIAFALHWCKRWCTLDALKPSQWVPRKNTKMLTLSFVFPSRHLLRDQTHKYPPDQGPPLLCCTSYSVLAAS